ncbi:hypothetical protein BC936DRAFT_139858 [Jimgerdemannia flammicorona]|uniref:Ribonuclease P protein subunit p29 n=1 Tax=Jimgerdemannia flammicorona TaxID=994334 RepID=A0A433DHB6_9FUNG|nr:hypothetical protein BC936DRAFT_139858 [Jimgerdemannia flammicorona]
MSTDQQDRNPRDLNLYAPLPDYVRHQQAHAASLSAVPLDPVTQTFVPGFVTAQVSSDYNARQVYNAKVKDKVLMLDNPAKESADKKERKQNRRGTRRMTAREKREKKVYEVPADCQDYALFIPLHNLWLQYVEELFGRQGNAITHAQKLVKADYHGAIMTVVRSKCHSYIGVTGIMVQETENLFRIVTEQNRIKAVPKAASVFSFKVRNEVYTIYGNHIRYRAAERAAKKFKAKPTIDL